MTDLEKEIMRQIHEMDKEVKVLRERVAVLESQQYTKVIGTSIQWPEPYTITCGGGNE